MNVYQFNLLSPYGEVFKGDIISLTAPALQGSIGILANHAPMIVSLKPGVVTIKTEGKQRSFDIQSGVLEVSASGSCVALVSACSPIKQ